MKAQTYFIIFIIISFCFSCSMKKNEKNQNQTEIINQIKDRVIAVEKENLYCIVENQYTFSGHDSLNLKQLTDPFFKNKLFFYFSTNTCSPCIDSTVELINKNLLDSTVLFISPDYPVRFREDCYGQKLLTLKNGGLGIPIEQQEIPPFFFMLDDSLKMKSFHVVNKLDFQRTDKFLSEIKGKI